MKTKLFKLITMMTFFLCMLPMIILPIKADTDDYVVDTAGKLGTSTAEELNAVAKEFSEKHHINFYIRIVESHGIGSIESYSESLFNSENLGYGENKEGIMLVIAMEDRSFNIVAHGEKAQKIFDDAARESIADKVVNDYLVYNDFSGGAKEFLNAGASTILTNYGIKGGIATIIPLIISSLTIFVFGSRHKTKGVAHEALAYIPVNGVNMQVTQDFFLNRTVTRTYNPPAKSNSGGGGGFHSSSGGGFSHTSGHF